MITSARVAAAVLLLAWFYAFVPVADPVVYLLAVVWLTYLLAGTLGLLDRQPRR